MWKKFIIGLFAIGLTTILWTEAHAGCRIIGGSLYCASWLTGSEVCEAKQFFSNKLCKDKECTIKCTVDGFNKGYHKKVEGIAFCAKDHKKYESVSKAGFYYHDDKNDYDHDDKDDNKCERIGKHGILRCPATLKSELPLVGMAELKEGKATIDIDPDPAECENCCPRGSDLITFTAERFNAIAELCFDHYGHKKCVEFSNEDCRIDEDKISLDKSRSYKCKDLRRREFSHKW